MGDDIVLSDATALSDDVCAKEEIHLCAAIQPHGLLVGLDAGTLRLLTKSANVDPIFPGTRIGEFPTWLPPAAAEECRTLVLSGRDEASLSVDVVGIGTTDVHCFVADGIVFCEFEVPSELPIHSAVEGSALAVAMAIEEIEVARGVASLSMVAAQAVRAISGFERVMVYRFDADGNGEVLGESLADDWGQSFLGLRFPASDIPAQARRLYRVTHSRWMPTRDYEAVPLLPAHDENWRPFNLSLSWYRSVSPLHRMYQKNIDVDGAMSVSVLQDGDLWGLVIGHHRKAHRVSAEMRHHVDAIVRAFSMRLDALVKHTASQEMTADMHAYSAMLRKLAASEDFLGALTEGEPSILGMLPGCTGAAVLWDDGGASGIRTLGVAPPHADLLALTTWLRSVATASLFSTHSLTNSFPSSLAYREVASGVLAILFEDSRRPVLLLFRPEIVQSVSWAGKPEKLTGPDGIPNLPRRAFDRWTEVKRGHSQPWRPWELDIAATICATVNDVILRQTRRLHDLSVSKERYLALLQHASDGVHILDDKGALIEASDSFCRMLGYARDEIIGKNVAEWEANFARAELAEVVARQFDRDEISTFETRHRRKDGSIFDVEVTGLRMDLDGRCVLYNSSRDITERRALEQQVRESRDRFASFAEVSSDWFWEMDRDLRFSWFSERFAEVTGRDPASVIGLRREDLAAFIEPDDRSRHLEDLYAHRPFRNFDYPIDTGGGRKFLRVSGTPPSVPTCLRHNDLCRLVSVAQGAVSNDGSKNGVCS